MRQGMTIYTGNLKTEKQFKKVNTLIKENAS